MLICDKCGSTYDQGKFCKKCGVPLREFYNVQSMVTNTSMLECRHCGRVYDEGKFCVFCGIELSEIVKKEPVRTVLRCTGCGSEFEEGKFCKKCGSPLEVVNVTAGPAPSDIPAPPDVPELGEPAVEETKPAEPAPEVPAPTVAEDKPAEPEPEVAAPTVDEEKPAEPEPEEKDISDIIGSSIGEEFGTYTAPSLRCVECGSTFRKGTFCTICGGDLEKIGGEPADEKADEPAPTEPPQETAPQAAAEVKVDETPVADAASAAKRLRCVECGTEFEKGKFCTVCGGDLKEIDAAPTEEKADEPAPAEPPQETAPQAAAEVKADEAAPEEEPSAEEKKPLLRCTLCGMSFDKGKFCKVCGGKLEEVQPEPEQPKPQQPAMSMFNTPPANVADNIVGQVLNDIPQTQAAPQQSGLKCRGCGKLYEKGKFCTVCGGMLDPIGAAPQPAPQAAAPVGFHCEQCGKAYEKGKFCTVCGGRLVPNGQPMYN